MFASLGNGGDVSTNDLLECWEQDKRTAAVILYVDTFGNPERVTRIARRVSRNKPILALKGRRRAKHVLTEARSDMAAALRGDAVVDALLHQAGCCGSAASTTCSRPPSSLSASRCRADGGSGS
jgi:acyl-CoA synthetase (NDP forming)